MKFKLVPGEFVLPNGKFDLEKALIKIGHFAGECYEKNGYDFLCKEDVDKTLNRVDVIMKNDHHSPVDHISVTVDFEEISKCFAMLLNNERMMVTSEKSSRYTPILEESVLDPQEKILYDKWKKILVGLISESYGNVFDKKKIVKLAQEKARYMVSVFTKTIMIHSLSLRQINNIYTWVKNFDVKYKNYYVPENFYKLLKPELEYFTYRCEELNLIDERLTRNEKNRFFSLFSPLELERIQEYYGDVYVTKYMGTFAQLAQAHRHRTLEYSMRVADRFYVPQIIGSQSKELYYEWISDINNVKNSYPQGMLLYILERGSFDNFILKCKERECIHAQVEVMKQTRRTMENFLNKGSWYVRERVGPYLKGPRCNYPDYKCLNPCGLKNSALARIV